MAETRAAVTDTHPLLDHAGARPARLGSRARAHFDACERREAILHVPAMVDLTPEQVYLAAEAQPNDDRFDALVCAAARVLELPLMTRDEQIRASRLVKVLW